jgi:hypothetical protein
MRTHECWNKIEKITGFCERGNERESGDNKFCSIVRSELNDYCAETRFRLPV